MIHEVSLHPKNFPVFFLNNESFTVFYTKCGKSPQTLDELSSADEASGVDIACFCVTFA